MINTISVIKDLNLARVVIIVAALQISACSSFKANQDSVVAHSDPNQSNLSVDMDTGLGIAVENGDISNIFSKAKDKIASVFTTSSGEQQSVKAETKKAATSRSDDWREKRQWWQRGTPVL